jgi:ABC-2 type transport system ATP-binding protein
MRLGRSLAPPMKSRLGRNPPWHTEVRLPPCSGGECHVFVAMLETVVIEARNLRKTFGETIALNDLSFDLRRNEIVGLLGVNGAGKTTALNMLLGLTTPTAGTIRIFGKDLMSHRVEILRRANFASAYVALPGNLTVAQNLYVFAKLYGVKNHRARIAELLELLEISALRKRVTGQLSAGESTRVQLCKAFINDPELLMLDEPTASLDPDIADKVRKFVRHRQRERGSAILYTSHNMRDIEEVCDRIIFIHRGKVVTSGPPAEVVAHFKRESLEDVFIQIARSELNELFESPK